MNQQNFISTKNLTKMKIEYLFRILTADADTLRVAVASWLAQLNAMQGTKLL